MEREIKTQSLDRVLAFLPLFEDQDSKFYEIPTDCSVFDLCNYANGADEFIEILYSEELIIPFDWLAWRDEAGKFFRQPELLESADLTTLQKLLTTHARQERFFDGHFVAMIKNGHIVAILKRLKQIRLEMESSQLVD